MCVHKTIDVSDCPSGSEDEGKEEGATGSGITSGGGSGGPQESLLSTLQDKLKELTTAYDLMVKNSHQLSKFTSELESGGNSREKIALLKITSAAMVKVRKEQEH